MGDRNGPEPDDLVVELHEHLVATRERPVDRTAQRWIGEAEAITGDLVGENLEDDVLLERIGHVRALLAEVGETGDQETTEHVDAARDLATEILDR